MSKNDNVSDNIFQKQGINEISSGNLSTAAQFPRLNKLKIVGNGMNNWSVATCGPFYLIDTDQNSSTNNPATSNDNVPQPLTGATNLITHYGLLSTYHKFCGKPFKETLSSFLPNITGNLDVPASENGSSLMSLSNKPPVQKEISFFSNNSLTDAFRLYNEKLPQCAHWFSNQAQNPITFDDKSKHRSSENKKRKRRDSNLTTSFTELPPTTTATTVSSSNSMPVNNNSNNTDTSQLLTNPSSIVHDSNSSSQHVGISTTAKISLNDNSTKMISPGSSLFSNQNPPAVVISTLTIKPKKSKRSDDEEKKKKKKKEKKKKRERNID